MRFIKPQFGLLCIKESERGGGRGGRGREGGRGSDGMCAAGKLEAEPRGNQSELLHPPLLCQSHRGLRCALQELIPPKLDCFVFD